MKATITALQYENTKFDETNLGKHDRYVFMVVRAKNTLNPPVNSWVTVEVLQQLIAEGIDVIIKSPHAIDPNP